MASLLITLRVRNDIDLMALRGYLTTIKDGLGGCTETVIDTTAQHTIKVLGTYMER